MVFISGLNIPTVELFGVMIVVCVLAVAMSVTALVLSIMALIKSRK
ncbi:hypothetical protein HQ545_06155 [Candidatus Woesearchaeota archaeon]|nr:hypothetical protein [Candidatus Woesearchaeota archaeon]